MYRKKISLLLALTMLACSLLGGCGMKPAEDDSCEQGIPEKEGYVLDFSTEFNDGRLDTDMFESMGIKVFSNLGDYPEWWQQICDMGVTGFKTNFPDAYTEWWLSTH